MTIAELAATIRARAVEAARAQVTLAWRTAYYHRVKHMPDLRDELEDVTPGDGAWEAGDVDAQGNMTEERMTRVWGQIKTGVMAWNARFAADGARA